jgi:hypothetical protein
MPYLIGLLTLIYALFGSIIDVLAQGGILGIVEELEIFINEIWNGKG